MKLYRFSMVLILILWIFNDFKSNSIDFQWICMKFNEFPMIW
jgi:hypothetical protein